MGTLQKHCSLKVSFKTPSKCSVLLQSAHTHMHTSIVSPPFKFLQCNSAKKVQNEGDMQILLIHPSMEMQSF